VIFTSLRQRENLVRAMLDGRKRAPSEGDIA
jgi:cytochrome b